MGVDLQQLGSGMRKATEAWLTSYKQSQLGWNSLNNSQWVRDSSPMSEDFKFSFSASQHFSWNHEHYSFIRKIACSAWHEHGTIGFEIMTYEIPIQCSDYRAIERQRDRETELQFEPWVMYRCTCAVLIIMVFRLHVHCTSSWSASFVLGTPQYSVSSHSVH